MSKRTWVCINGYLFIIVFIIFVFFATVAAAVKEGKPIFGFNITCFYLFTGKFCPLFRFKKLICDHFVPSRESFSRTNALAATVWMIQKNNYIKLGSVFKKKKKCANSFVWEIWVSWVFLLLKHSSYFTSRSHCMFKEATLVIQSDFTLFLRVFMNCFYIKCPFPFWFPHSSLSLKHHTK